MTKYHVINSISKWNKDRGNTDYDVGLEFGMLTEELQELIMERQKQMLKYATSKELDPYAEETFLNMSEEDRDILEKDIKVGEADALADIVFVAIGGLYKLSGSDKQVRDIMDAVIAANNTKGMDKVDGKITKPDNFIGPEERIKEILYGSTNIPG